MAQERPDAAARGGRHRVIRLPDQVAVRVRDIAGGHRAPAVPRDAATVVLLRPAGGRGAAEPTGFEVFLLRRRQSMAFAPGAHVFPGGSVDPRDADTELGWAGPDPAEWARMLTGDSDPAGGPAGEAPRNAAPGRRGAGPAELARALLCAAVRETFEECGVLLAGPAAGSVVADTRGDEWERDRLALVEGSLSMAALLARRGLVIRSDLLRPWSRWITPEVESRRFDTRFFTAALPPGQRTRDIGGESDQSVWLAPQAAISAARRGEISLMPPTAATLAELARFGDAAAALAAGTDMTPRQPHIWEDGGAVWLTIPDGVEYPL